MAATTKVTITLPNEQLKKVRECVAEGRSGSVSAFIQHAVKIAIWDAAGWRKMLDEALEQTGGPLTKEERDWADSVLGVKKSKTRSGRKAA